MVKSLGEKHEEENHGLVIKAHVLINRLCPQRDGQGVSQRENLLLPKAIGGKLHQVVSKFAGRKIIGSD